MRTRALILLGHGSSRNEDSSRPTHQQAEEIRRRNLFDEVSVAFWKEEPHFCHALDLIKSDDVFIIPFFISNGYFTEQIIPHEFGIEGRLTARGSQRIFYGEPVGTHSSMTNALCHCAERVVQGHAAPFGEPKPQETTLVIVGHGTTRNEHSAEDVLQQVKLLQQQKVYAEVLPAFIEQPPYDREVLSKIHTRSSIIIPFFISDGLHSREDVPINIGFAKRSEPWKTPVHLGEEKYLWYSNAIGSEPWMADVILDRVKELTFP